METQLMSSLYNARLLPLGLQWPLSAIACLQVPIL